MQGDGVLAEHSHDMGVWGLMKPESPGSSSKTTGGLMAPFLEKSGSE